MKTEGTSHEVVETRNRRMRKTDEPKKKQRRGRKEIKKKRRRGSVWTRTKTSKDGRKKQRELRWKAYLEKIYFDPRHPASFKGANKVHQIVKEEGRHNISLSQIRTWLQNQESFTLNKPIRRAFRRLRVIVSGLRDQYEADLADMQKLKDKNDGIRFLLVVIDVFSRMMWVEPLTTKSEDEVIKAFKKIFVRAPKPRRLRTDRGGEFTGNKVETFFDSSDIEHWTAHNDEMKANYAERVIRTLKSSLYGYMRKNKTGRYVDVLQDLVASYNDTQHRSTGMKPSEVTPGDVERHLWWHQYKPKTPHIKGGRKPTRFKYKTGDHVCISHKAERFHRGHDEKWTREIFQIRQPFERFGIPKYRLTDVQGEELKGTFYEAELQKVEYSENNSFEIEKVIDRRRQSPGKRKFELLIKWKGWPDKFNSWIPESEADLTSVNSDSEAT